MKLVIADTGPINYLLLTGYIDLLPVLFEKVTLPSSVSDELRDPDAPIQVRNWVASPPPWLIVQSASVVESIAGLGAGEAEAITLALELHADLLLMDDRRGVKAARGRGIEVTGTLAVLALAGRRALLDLPEAFARLKQTNFRYSQQVMDRFLEDYRGKS